MPNILKRFINPKTTPYLFPDSSTLLSEGEEASELASPLAPDAEAQLASILGNQGNALDYAKLQADAIMESARQDAAELLERSKLAMDAELDEIREAAREEGFRQGHAEGISHAMGEAQDQRIAQAKQLAADVSRFLDKATAAQEDLLDQSKAELRDLAIAVAEKIVRVSLKNSGEIIVRMISRATEKMRRKEWVHIYIAGCDAKSFAQVSPNLSAALGAISDQVRIMPLPDEEAGTCMIETPDEIIDASVSTQFGNIRSLLSDSYVQSPDFSQPYGR